MSESEQEIKDLEKRLKDLKKTEDGNNNPYAIPGAIIMAGIIVAGALVFGGGGAAPVATNTGGSPPPTQQQQGSIDSIRPVNAEDHIRGSLNAAVKIVEYSDYECPFCKRFHSTLAQIMDEYDENEVAWIYRQFPLDSLHPRNARRAAIASECVAELGGNDAFWQFTDRFFELTPSNDQTDFETVVPQIIGEIGIDLDAFTVCAESGKYDAHIEDDINDALATGGRGTPWSVVLGPDGQTFPISGAQPYSSVKQIVDLALKAQ